MDKEKRLKVAVAMSGGVDSSVSAALLKEAGFDVVGVFMKFWHPDNSKGENRCCSAESEKRARTVCHKLNIPFYVINMEKEFKKKVVDYFIAEYKAGRTPNPCVVCNYEIKFGLLIEKALKMEAKYIATGHYARISNDKLLKGIDKNKDQSYFLWKLSQKQLSRVLFP
ncbi:MAG: tRNA 2-thiouridine(34) synthase MnmA, partial [Candidatus Nealsonbacteria bacterium]|nr:tRNA 2-thiouridine(34) synthase MnmA [Candidatus Nealsonbacteria bacterium]